MALTKDDFISWQEPSTVKADTKAYGFAEGVGAAMNNFGMAVVPNAAKKAGMHYKETGDWKASIAAGVTNPVTIATAFIPGGIIAGAIYGAAADTITDYAARKNDDINAQYSTNDLLEQTATGIVAGVVLNRFGKAFTGASKTAKETISSLKPEQKQSATEIMKAIDTSNPPEHLTRGEQLFLNDNAVRTDKLARQGIIENPMSGEHLNFNNPIENKSEWADSFKPKFDPSAELKTEKAKNYYSNLSEHEQGLQANAVANADRLVTHYSDNASELAYSYSNLAFAKKVQYNEILQKAFKDKEVRKFLDNQENKPELWNALYKKSENPIAIKAAQVYRDLGHAVTNDIRFSTDIGYIDTRFGAQRWDKDIMRELADSADGATKFLDDLNSAGYMIKSENGSLRPVTMDDAKYIINNMGYDKEHVGATVFKKQERVLVTDNPAGAFAIEKIYGGDRHMVDVLTGDATSGARDVARYSMFGERPEATLAAYSNITNGKNIEMLRETIMPSMDTSAEGVRMFVQAFNTAIQAGRTIKSIVNPLWQTIFMPVDLVGSMAQAIGHYQGDLIRGLFRGKFGELKEFMKYSKIGESELKGMRSYMRQAIDVNDNKLLQGIGAVDAKFNGNHLADMPVRKLTTFLHALGERELLLRGESKIKVDKTLLKEAMADGRVLPDSSILLDKANKLKEAGNHELAKQYFDAANVIDAHMTSAVSNANPTVYRNLFKMEKGSAQNLAPIRMARWVWNQWISTNYTLAKGAVKCARTGDFTGASANLIGLAGYGLAIGYSETLMEMLLKPEEFEDEDAFEKHLLLNTAAGTVFGGVYMLKTGFGVVPNSLYRASKHYYFDEDPDKAADDLSSIAYLSTAAWNAVQRYAND